MFSFLQYATIMVDLTDSSASAVAYTTKNWMLRSHGILCSWKFKVGKNQTELIWISVRIAFDVESVFGWGIARVLIAVSNKANNIIAKTRMVIFIFLWMKYTTKIVLKMKEQILGRLQTWTIKSVVDGQLKFNKNSRFNISFRQFWMNQNVK